MTIGERVASARVRRGWTQERLSEQTNLSRVTISKIESGHRHAKATELVTLARLLGVRISELLEDTRELLCATDSAGVEDQYDQPEPSRCPACGSRLFKSYGMTYSAATDTGSMTGWHCVMCCTTFETHRVGRVTRAVITGVKPIQLLPGELHDLRRDSSRRTACGKKAARRRE